MDQAWYVSATQWVLRGTDASARNLEGKRVKLRRGVPHRLLGRPVTGPQAVTVTVQVRDEDLGTVLGLSERLAMRAGSQFCRVYRDLAVVRVEYTLPRGAWREVRLRDLPHRPNAATVGQRALGPSARVGWDPPHKAMFGGTQSGKTVCLSDFVISLAKHGPEMYSFVIVNPKNDPKLNVFERLAHLAAPVATNYDDSLALLKFATAEMERRRADHQRAADGPRWVVVVDEVAQLCEVEASAGGYITQITQMAGGLRMHLVAASQAANPSVFGAKGSLAKANFGGRLIFQLPHDQSYLACGLKGQHTELLGRGGDGLAINGERVTRFRAALPDERDIDALPRMVAPPAWPELDELAGDAAIEGQSWEIPPAMLAYAMEVSSSATQLQKQFGGAMAKARQVRDYLAALLEARAALGPGLSALSPSPSPNGGGE